MMKKKPPPGKKKSPENPSTQWQTTFDAINDAIFLADSEGRILRCNEAFKKFINRQWHEIIGKHCYELVHGEKDFIIGCPFIEARTSKRRATKEMESGENWLSVTVDPLLNESGEVEKYIHIISDITKHKKVEGELIDANERLRTVLDSMDALAYVADMETFELLFMNKYGRDVFGEYAGKKCWEVLQVGQQTQCPFCTNDRLLTEEGKPRGVYRWEFQNTKTGNWYECRDQAIQWTSDRLVRMEIATDITERKKADESLRESQRMITTLLSNLPGMVYRCRNDKDWTMEFVSDGCFALTGYYPDDFIDNARISFAAIIYPDDREMVWETVQNSIREKKQFTVSYRIQTKDGAIKWVWEQGQGIFTEKGELMALEGFVTDITEYHRLEDQLRHSQKLEGIGQLAGGIAHDFNNILNAVVGYAGLLQMKMDKADPLKHFADEIMTVGNRGAMLTHQILAFSRKQTLDVKPADINEIVKGLQKMLHRLVREDIIIEQKLFGNDLVVMADASQIDQVIINLVINARDAMPKGGKLTIETRKAKSSQFTVDSSQIEKPSSAVNREQRTANNGDFAEISVTDTGCGMDAETQARIFEPFFTTKEVGKGTGLGLAVVHGIVKQHNGYINVYSEKGKGTIFKIYFPLTISDLGLQDADLSLKSEIQIPKSEKGETILVAEDDASVRKLSRLLLEQNGYKVIEAVDGEDAVDKFRENKDSIKLALLDGIMPNKNGKEVYDIIKAMTPQIKVIFMSGYVEDVFSKAGIPEKTEVFIQKPVKPNDLLIKVREMLDK